MVRLTRMALASEAAAAFPPEGRLDCWVVTDGRAGIENQGLGLAEAIGRRIPLRVVAKRIVVKSPWRSLPRQVWGDPFARLASAGALLRPPFPDLWIGCGRLSVPLTMAVKERNPKTFTVQLQDPRAPLRAFDLVIPPTHDGLSGANVFPIAGAPHRVTRERLEAEGERLAPMLAHLPRPRVAALIGGPNRAYRFSARRRAEIGAALRALALSGAGLMVTPSRRTEPATISAIAEALAGLPHFLWDGRPLGDIDNPYFGILGLADHILVTQDSVNMAAEAAVTGKPLQFLTLDPGLLALSEKKFARFRETLYEQRIARMYTGRLRRWAYRPLDETSRAAEEVIRRLLGE